ncbi:Hypothetical predicted protein [Pelobates cultripes]|uniref:Uncharacterized protein n=1 Tax=Pelobates cultripes TaxID=61616 RepID=A0AAD1VSJ5_PELCU|nr:Hypothetical predicted protein [Pelobates cultripes]
MELPPCRVSSKMAAGGKLEAKHSQREDRIAQAFELFWTQLWSLVCPQAETPALTGEASTGPSRCHTAKRPIKRGLNKAPTERRQRKGKQKAHARQKPRPPRRHLACKLRRETAQHPTKRTHPQSRKSPGRQNSQAKPRPPGRISTHQRTPTTWHLSPDGPQAALHKLSSHGTPQPSRGIG